jgi:hypothetical protein
MTRAQALKLAKAAYENRWPGDYHKAYLHFNPKGGTKETRAAAAAELAAHKARRPTLPDETAERDDAYAEQVERYHETEPAWRKRRDALRAKAMSYRYQVGYLGKTTFGPYAGIHGSGDSWQEACEAAKITPELRGKPK